MFFAVVNIVVIYGCHQRFYRIWCAKLPVILTIARVGPLFFIVSNPLFLILFFFQKIQVVLGSVCWHCAYFIKV